MLIQVNRIKSDSDATLSTVFIDGCFDCFGLEDEYRADKVAGETRIPQGRYKVGVRDVGGFHGRYSAKFPSFHRGMLQVMEVPGFEYILIHIGNTEEDTAGCLLVGQNGCTRGNLWIESSTNAYSELYKKCIQSAIDGELWIQYRDLD